MNIYTLGYSGSSHEDLRHYVKATNAVLVDIRYAPHSRVAMWEGNAIGMAVGFENYAQVQALGNPNYKGDGPIKLLNPQAGARAIGEIFAIRNRPVILLCMCPNVETCHRKLAAEYVSSFLTMYRCHIEHLPARSAQWQQARLRELPPRKAR